VAPARPRSGGPLILGGTTEGRLLASKLHDVPHFYSLAGRTSTPNLAGIEPAAIHTGGFGGVTGLVSFCQVAAVAAVVDTTHPFATTISEHAVAACSQLALPLLRYTRAPWRPQPADQWTDVDELRSALTQVAAITGKSRAHVLVTTGSQDLTAIAKVISTAYPHELFIRVIEPPQLPDHPRLHLLYNRGPFSVADELRTFTTHKIDVLVSKNSGGESTRAKLLAAQQLGLPVLMMRRPQLAQATEVFEVDAAYAWCRSQCPPVQSK
jgi:precorrin-6A/cobalt-precorrin-6A reductase